jgi:hypothetical protein
MEALRVGITESSSDRVSESVLGVEVVHGTAHLVATSVRVAEAMNCYWAPFLEYAKRRGELRPNVQLEDAVRWLTTIVFYFLTLPEMRPKPDELEAYLRTFVVESIVSLPND